MGLPSNLVEILISGVYRPHGLLVTLHWISIISWPLINNTLPAHFRTNVVEIFIRGCTDLLNFWSHFIEIPSYPGLWLAIHFPSILDKLVGIIIRGSSDLIKIWSYIVEFSSSSDCLSTCTFPEKLYGIDLKFCGNIHYSSPYIWWLLVMLHCISSASWPLINLALSVYFWTNCSTATCIHNELDSNWWKFLNQSAIWCILRWPPPVCQFVWQFVTFHKPNHLC